ncbi:MAG TPA: hypothetical protein DCP90_07495 [Clostridiales bacterium]|nr:MAG: hypothetical protein A2Y22_04275 [Clostridiales bacterium GWD2_32_59]HAN10441.1 hypothetical protein [Clostridiales bacterium]
MLNQETLEYVDNLISKIDAPEEFKGSLRSEIIRYIDKAYGNTSTDEIVNKFGSAERLADEISRKLADRISEDFGGIIARPSGKKHKKHHSDKPYGEVTQENSNVNIKLLYIPLIQIASGTERIHYYLSDDDDDDE